MPKYVDVTATVCSSNFTGCPADMVQRFQDAVYLCGVRGNYGRLIAPLPAVMHSLASVVEVHDAPMFLLANFLH